MTNLIGKSLDRYHILEQIGEGGMATVYKAFDTRLERDVAVKVIRTELFGKAIIERILKRFEREAKALARMSHPNIVNVYDYGEYEGAPYIVMEFMQSGTLKGQLGKPMPWRQALILLLPLANALAYAHKQKVIHRDLKPSNILLTEQGQPLLTDFGIAKILEIEDGQTLTGTGVGVGTPEYMAPEQGMGKDVDARADIYALGVVLYELLTGRKPYTADTPMAVIFKHITDPLPRPSSFVPDLPDRVEKLLLKALAKKAEDRYQNMDSLEKAMQSLMDLSQASLQQADLTVDDLEINQQAEKAVEQAERKAAEQAAKEKAEREAAIKAAKVKAEREAAIKAAKEREEREAARKTAKEKAEREATEKTARKEAKREAAMIAAKEKKEGKATAKATSKNISEDSQKSKRSKIIWFALGGIVVISIILGWVFKNNPTETAPTPTLKSTVIPTLLPTEITPTPTATKIPEVLLEPAGPIGPDNVDQLTLLGEWGDSVSQVVFSPDGQSLATLSGKHKIDILDANTLEEEQSIVVAGSVTTIAFSPDTNLIAMGLDNGEVQIWDVATADLGDILENHTEAVTVMAFTPNGKTLVTGAMDGLVNLWDVETGALNNSLEGNGGEITALAISPDGERVAYADYLYGGGSRWRGDYSDNDVNIRIWQISDGNYLNTLQPSSVYYRTDPVDHLEFSQDGATLISDFRVWDIITGQSVKASSSEDDKYTYKSGNDLLLIHSSWEDGLQIKNDVTGEEFFQISKEIFRVSNSYSWYGVINWQLSPNRESLVFLKDGILELWNLEGNILQASKQFDQIITFAYSPDGSQIALGISEQIQIRRVKDGVVLHQLTGTEGSIRSLSYSPDGNTIASGSKNGVLNLWSIENETLLRTESFEGESLENVKFSLSGSYLTAIYEGHMVIWPLASEEPMQVNDYQNRAYYQSGEYVFIDDTQFVSVEYIYQGQYQQVSGSKFIFGDIKTESSAELEKKGTIVTRFYLSPDKTNILYCTNDDQMTIIRLSDGSVIQKIYAPQSVSLSCGLAFKWSGSLIIVGGHPIGTYDGYSIQFFHADTRENIGSLDIQNGGLATLSPDNTLLTVHQSGRLLFYGLPVNGN